MLYNEDRLLSLVSHSCGCSTSQLNSAQSSIHKYPKKDDLFFASEYHVLMYRCAFVSANFGSRVDKIGICSILLWLKKVGDRGFPGRTSHGGLCGVDCVETTAVFPKDTISFYMYHQSSEHCLFSQRLLTFFPRRPTFISLRISTTTNVNKRL